MPNLEWELTYHWPTQETVSVNYVLKRREGGTYESGDCWCHENCYNHIPRTGRKLFPKKESIDGKVAHFWKGPGSFSSNSDCKFELIRKRRNESQRYAQFYHDLRQWLSSNEGLNSLYCIEFHESMSVKYSDFTLHHLKSEGVNWEETEILIIHKNRRRNPNSPNFIIIDLTQWTVEQISNFQDFGKRKILEEFMQLLSKVKAKRERDLLSEILDAVEKCVERYGERLEHEATDFSSTKEVKEHYRTIFADKKIIKDAADAEVENELQKRISPLVNEFGFTVEGPDATWTDLELRKGFEWEQGDREKNENKQSQFYEIATRSLQLAEKHDPGFINELRSVSMEGNLYGYDLAAYQNELISIIKSAKRGAGQIEEAESEINPKRNNFPELNPRRIKDTPFNPFEASEPTKNPTKNSTTEEGIRNRITEIANHLIKRNPTKKDRINLTKEQKNLQKQLAGIKDKKLE